MSFDRRRSKYVPLDVMVAFDDFGTKLERKWGMEGLCGWMLLLAAAKREVTQGQFTYTSEEEAWAKLGARATGYSLDAFFTYTGQCKKTRRTRHGRITYVNIRSWENWNTPRGGGQKPSKTHEFTGRLPGDTQELPQITRPEVEAEQEAERNEAEAERSVYDLPPLVSVPTVPKSAEIEIEVEAILGSVLGVERNSRQVLLRLANGLPSGAVAKVRESCQNQRPRKGVGWAVNALQSEINERSAA